MGINVPEVKQKIIKFLEERGPSLPVHITKVTGLSSMFSSAILSELISEKKVKTSNIKIGSSPLYLIPGHEDKLENFSDSLHGFEKEAFLRLKNSKFLEEEKQEPAVRHALKSLKDFAVPMNIENKIFWKYFLTANEELSLLVSKKEEILADKDNEMRKVSNLVWQDIDKEKYKEKITQIAKDIEGKQKEIDEEKEIALKKVLSPLKEEKAKIEEKIPKKLPAKNFFLEIKEKLEEKKIPLIEAVYVGKKDLILRTILEGQEVLLLAFDKKRISDSDLIKLVKKTKIALPICILSKGDMPKKMKDAMEAYKRVLNMFIL
jgi:hypothetical protein